MAVEALQLQHLGASVGQRRRCSRTLAASGKCAAEKLSGRRDVAAANRPGHMCSGEQCG